MHSGFVKTSSLMKVACAASWFFTQGCNLDDLDLLVDLFVPETYDDMDRRLDSFQLPSDYVWIARDVGGTRSCFGRQSAPYVERKFAAPWNDREVCTGLWALATSVGPVEDWSSPTQNGICTYHATIASGWRARMVGVWSYDILMKARSREEVLKYTTEEQTEALCRDHLHQDNLHFRTAKCFLPPEHALVTIRVSGKSWCG